MSGARFETSITEAAYSGVFNGRFSPDDNEAVQHINPELARAAIVRVETRGVPREARDAFLLGVALAEQALRRGVEVASLAQSLDSPDFSVADLHPTGEAA